MGKNIGRAINKDLHDLIHMHIDFCNIVKEHKKKICKKIDEMVLREADTKRRDDE